MLGLTEKTLERLHEFVRMVTLFKNPPTPTVLYFILRDYSRFVFCPLEKDKQNIHIY